MTSYGYKPPVDRLLSYGDCRELREWPNYLELGLTREHIPELIRMATDWELNHAGSESLEVWATVHAWRSLGQLGAEEAIEPLMQLLDEEEKDDWVLDELPIVFGMIGEKAIPVLASFLADLEHGLYAQTAAASALAKIATDHPETRERVVSVLTRQLKRHGANDPFLNGCLVGDLLDLKAVESAEVMREAFEADAVDLSISGDWEDVQIELGLRQERTTPVRNYFLESLLQEREKVVKQPKVGRNDPCPCGSGKKYKKCCLGKE